MSIAKFIQEFVNRKGGYMFFATVATKLLSIALTAIVSRILTKEDFAYIVYAHTIVSFLMPIMGFGIFQSFLKYAPVQEFMYQRKSLFKYTFITGLVASLVMMLLVILFAPLVNVNMPGSYQYLLVFSALIVSLFIFESVKNYLRIFYLNKSYARLEIVHAVLLFVVATSLSLWLGGIGYVLALVSVPLVLSLWLLIKKDFLKAAKKQFKASTKEMWSYGLYTSLGGMVSILIFSVDQISIPNLLDDPDLLADYKIMSIFPISLLILPAIILKTDFVKLVQEARNKSFLIGYVKNFMLLFLGISIAMNIFFYFLGDFTIELVFGEKYLSYTELLQVFALGVSGAFIFRVPFGNMMAVIGWTKISTVLAIVTLLVDVVLNYYWIQEWGIMGAAYATSLLLWLSGIVTFIIFLVYLRRLD